MLFTLAYDSAGKLGAGNNAKASNYGYLGGRLTFSRLPYAITYPERGKLRYGIAGRHRFRAIPEP